MKSRLWARLRLVVVAALGVAALVACEGVLTITWTNVVNGTVVNARIDPDSASAGISGVTVTLVDSAGSTAGTASTASSGAFSFIDVDAGTYTITASLSGYAFIDKQVVVAGNDLTVAAGKVLGFSSAGTDISIIAVWDTTFADVDSYLTFPVTDYWSGANPIFYYPYAGPGDVTGADPGFLPTTGEPERNKVYHGERQSLATTFPWGGSASEPAIFLDVDDTTGGGPETITIKSPPIPADVVTYNTNPDPATGLPTGHTYAWIGVMQYYVDAFNPTALSNEGVSGGANVRVFLIQGAEIKGRFIVPDYIAMPTASVLSINMFVRDDDVAYYHIFPDVRWVLDETAIKSAAVGPIVLAGPAR